MNPYRRDLRLFLQHRKLQNFLCSKEDMSPAKGEGRIFLLKAPVWLVAIFFISFFSLSCSPKMETAGKGPRVCFDERCVNVELAQTDEQRSRGLQFRESLGKNEGMLFSFFENKAHLFWMKDTLIPLDMIWLDHAGRIIYIAHNVLPCQSDPCPVYGTNKNSQYVLEINAGTALEMGLKEGNRADFQDM